MTELKKDVPSPCVRNCCLDQNDICLGCLRHIDEITGWHQMSNQQKQQVLLRCDQRKIERQQAIKRSNS